MKVEPLYSKVQDSTLWLLQRVMSEKYISLFLYTIIIYSLYIAWICEQYVTESYEKQPENSCANQRLLRFKDFPAWIFNFPCIITILTNERANVYG